MKKTILSIAFVCCIVLNYAQEARLLRFPTIYNNQVVFSYAGDLYTVDKSGGEARKLTNNIGYEMFARFSPDGKTIAFTGQYDGNTEVYTIPAEGGAPKRLTYTATLHRDDIADRMGPNNIVMTWRDNEHIIYRSRQQSFNDFNGQLYVANVNGGLSEQLPFPVAGFCSYSADKKKLAYNRVFREFRTWKYYRGGMADDIWIYDFDTKKIEDVTNNPAQDIEPMWIGDKIYFLSDRDRTMNLFCYDLNTKQTHKVTNYTDYDIKFPSLGNNAIVYEHAGYLYTVDIPSEKITQINITIHTDNPYSRTAMVDASKFMEGNSIGADGNRLVVVARGDVFTVPADKGITRDITNTSGVHERNAVWSPDGKYVAYVSDSSGEDEIYIQVPDGYSKPVRITFNGDVYKYELQWSPDSKKIAWADRNFRIEYVDINTRAQTLVEQSDIWEMRDFSWSPDSKWLAYVAPQKQSKDKIFMYHTTDGTKVTVTDGWYDSYNPVFSPDKKYLYFISNRDFNPSFSGTDFEIAYRDMSKIYLIPLSRETANPFAPVNNEVELVKDSTSEKKGEEKKKGKEEPKAKKEDENKDMKVDVENLSQRVMALNVDAGNYYDVQPVDGKVYYMREEGGDKRSLRVFDVDGKDKKETVLGDADNMEISANNKKMKVHKGENYYVIDLPGSKLELNTPVNLSDMKIEVNKKEEWVQIFNEAWRQMRDFFYAPNMQGVDWKAMREKYGVLVPYVNQRADLDYIIGEMIGELNVGHSYVSGGDIPRAERIQMGLLGAQLSRDASGYFRINKILEGANFDKSLRSPLTEVGVNVHTGDYIISVDGVATTTTNDIYSLLVNKANKEVELEVNNRPSADGAHKALVIPVADEKDLYYYNWVQHNIHFVDSVSGGKIGYIHIPNMGEEGLNEFMKHYYPQIRRQALVIDDRGNGGGFVSPLIAERLARQLVYFNMARDVKDGTPNPDLQYGPKVCLINQFSASDGDIFPYRFRSYKLGQLIGKRTWGGIVGIRGSLPFIDGGQMTKPEFTSYTATGFAIEGHGVDPDIDVDNDPAHEYAGIDDQLNKAIQVLLDELKTNPPVIPPVPPFPDKTK